MFLVFLPPQVFLSISPVRADNLSGGTGDLGLIVERATGSLLVVDRSERAAVGGSKGLAISRMPV